jgi:phosphoenolpyruvate carboxykinase (ATP)
VSKLSADGPLVVETGEHTGRSAQDKFMVRDDGRAAHRLVGATNKPMSPTISPRSRPISSPRWARRKICSSRTCMADRSEHRVRVRVVTELAWHNLFIRTMLVRPEEHELRKFIADYTIIDLPSFRADPARHGCRSSTVIAVNMTGRLILIGGTRYVAMKVGLRPAQLSAA